MNIGRIARNVVRMVPAIALSASFGCVPGKTGLQMFIEKTNTMIADASKNHGCIGRGIGEIESGFFSASTAETMAEGDAHLDYMQRCVDPKISDIKVEKERGAVTKVIVDGQPMNIKLFVCGRENVHDDIRDKYFSAVVVCGQKY